MKSFGDNDSTAIGVEYNSFHWWSMSFRIAHITGALSMIGSGWIIMEILLDRQKIKMTYHRIMFGLSFFDFMSSFGFFMGNWAQYHYSFTDSDSVDFTKGNIETCNASGFIIYLGSLTIPLYSASLSMYYYLMICHRWREEQFKKKLEPYVHTLIPSMGIIIAIIPLSMDLYNPFYFYCFPGFNSIRGNKEAGGIFRMLSLLTVFSSAIITSYSMISINMKVKKTYDRYLSNNYSSRFLTRERKFQVRSKRVKMMTLLYLIPFLITWVSPTIIFLARYLSFVSPIFHGFWPDNVVFNFAVQVYVGLVLPLQGFLNWFVYMYRRYQTANMSWFSLSRGRFSVVQKCFYMMRDIFVRTLNLAATEDDNDCLLGSGMEVIDFEYNNNRSIGEEDVKLASIHISDIEKNDIAEEDVESSSIHISEIEKNSEGDKCSIIPIITGESNLKEKT